MWALNFPDLSYFCNYTKAFSHFIWFEHMSIFHLIIVLITYHIILRYIVAFLYLLLITSKVLMS